MFRKWAGGLLILAFLLTGALASAQQYEMSYSFTSLAGSRNQSSAYQIVDHVSVTTPPTGLLSSGDYSITPLEGPSGGPVSAVTMWYLY